MLIKTLSLTVLLLLSFNILAVEPCSAVPEGQQRRDGVCSHKDAALRARQVFSYILSLEKYCDEATREEINKWYLSNKKLINNAVIISKLPLKEIINNTDSALWRFEKTERITESCAYVRRKIRDDSPSLFGGRVGEYLNTFEPSESQNKGKE